MSESLTPRDDVSAEPAEPDALVFRVAAGEAGERLDAYLAARVPGLSRTAVKRAIDEGDALVDGRAAKPSYKLRGGEEVEFDVPAPPAVEVAPEDIPLSVVHEDEEIVVIDKPAGMVVHPAAGVSSGTLVNALVFHFQKTGAGGRGPGAGVRPLEGDPDEAAVEFAGGAETETFSQPKPGPRPPAPDPRLLRPGIVHRLDRDTSGLVVVAKTARAHESLSDQFRARTVFKSYVALVHGVTREERGKIDQPLGRDPRNRTRMSVVRGGRAALTVWRVRQRFTRMTLLDVEIKTGRTHQIRVHMAWMKHPVVGDEAYGGGRDRTIQDAPLRARIASLGRQFLHAERLAFEHPRTGERLLFRSPLPEDLQAFLDALGGGS